MATVDYVVVALVVGGAFFSLVGAIGIIRMPDLYTRAHATSKSETLGAVLALGGVALAFESTLPAVKSFLLLLFMFLTNPTAAHAITRAAYDQGIEPWTKEDED